METIIRLEGINKIYRTDEVETQALENVNLQVNKGEFLSIMGPSGCGKSTLLNIMGLLDAPTSGSVLIDGTATEKLGDKALAAFRNEKLGFVFQSFHLINSLNVIDNVKICEIASTFSSAFELLSVLKSPSLTDALPVTNDLVNSRIRACNRTLLCASSTFT